jgi:hypothetical protein
MVPWPGGNALTANDAKMCREGTLDYCGGPNRRPPLKSQFQVTMMQIWTARMLFPRSRVP